MIPPIDQDICKVPVTAPLRTIGTTSLAWAGELAMKSPQGIPSNAWPITRTVSESAKNVMKMVAFIRNRPRMVVQR